MKRLCLIPLIFVSVVQAQEIVIREGVGIRVPGARRSAVHTDPVEYKIVTGTWTAPVAGKEGWAKVAANAQGDFQGGPTGGGYVFASVDSTSNRIALLEASGHSLVYINGVPRTGDPYSYGYSSLPIELKKGKNELVFLCGRGRLAAKIIDPPKPISIDLRDSTTPDIVRGTTGDLWAGVVIRNATKTPLTGLAFEVAGKSTPVWTVPALGVRKVGVQIPIGSDGKYEVKLLDKGKVVDTAKLELRVREPGQTYKQTFASQIDGSVQHYAVQPASSATEERALFLSLHGASVEALGQAEAYSPKAWGHLVAPTNRRPFGFDWEEIGRLDALEVLALAKAQLVPDNTKIYLTGHSMGGHGTWQLGAHYPHLFAAIAPSAGWISFQTYAGGQTYSNPTPVEQMLLRAGSPSDTLGLKNNLMSRGIYILHGDADDNVPVAQARQMREALTGHKDIQWWEEKGAGHWWDANPEPGSDAVDFAPIFDFFSKHRLPRISEVREIDFTTASPGVSSQLHWAHIHQQEKPFVFSRVRLKSFPQLAMFTGTTENVAVLSLAIGVLADGKKITLEIDGQKLEPNQPTINRIYLYKKDGKWSVGGSPRPNEKSPERCGGFKDVFKNRFALVYGTGGNAEENAWALAKARYDAETFWYRGNGSVDILPDTAIGDKIEDRNYVVYGNANTNRAYTKLVDEEVMLSSKGLKYGSTEMPNAKSISAYFIRPRKGSDRTSVGVIGGTDIVGMRLCDRVPIFTSGAAFPDMIVYGPEALVEGTKGVRLAGFFGNDWRVASGDWATP